MWQAVYGAKIQYSEEEDNSEKVDQPGINRIQQSDFVPINKAGSHSYCNVDSFYQYRSPGNNTNCNWKKCAL